MIRIVVPMGGEGKRFAELGYTFPKPLVEIAGKPMIEIVARNLAPSEEHRFIFVCRKEHIDRFALGDVLRLVADDCDIVVMPNPTAGALCSVLLALEHLNNGDELLVANADQYIDVSLDRFLGVARSDAWDGCMMTFPSTHPKWSYAKVEDGQVVAVAERMILKNASVMGEFYVCPVYNELILMGKRITTFPIDSSQMHSLGTPEDVQAFASSKAKELSW